MDRFDSGSCWLRTSCNPSLIFHINSFNNFNRRIITQLPNAPETSNQKLSFNMLQLKSLVVLLLLAAISVDAATLRARRDVSHLPLEYLPPVVLPPLPSREYLPPVEQHAASLPHVLQPPRDYLPPAAEQLKLSNEYLPPAPIEAETTEAPISEETTTVAAEPETTTVAQQPAAATEAEPEVVTESQSEPEEASPSAPSTHEAIEQGEGTLQDDGYHYEAPEIVPDLAAPEAAATVEGYLPPLVDNAVVVAELPQSGESAALLDDGYHYRAIRRLRL